MIDTHSHIYAEQFAEDRAQTIERALEQGVELQLLPAIDHESHESMFEVARQWECCLPMMGLHPTSINENPQWREHLSEVERYLESPPQGISKFWGVGEIGLDFYWSNDYREEQIEAFRAQIEMALRYDLPIAVHTRSAWDEMEQVISEYSNKGLRGVLHAYFDDFARYERLCEHGDFLFGIGGVVTFKKSPLAEVVKHIPLERLLVETDCPYLAPSPYRGKRNEPAYVNHTAAKIAELKGCELSEIDVVTTQNARRVFGL